MGIRAHTPSRTCTAALWVMLGCDQAEPPELRLVIAANPPTPFSDKADPHYPECVLIYVRNERGGVGSGDAGS